MRSKVFFDTDVLLDVLFERKPFCDDAGRVFTFCETGSAKGVTSALIIANLHYFLRKEYGARPAIEAIRKVMTVLEVLPLTEKELTAASASDFSDFEDGVQFFVANNHGVDVILTRNARDFKKSSIRVMSPKEFLKAEQ